MNGVESGSVVLGSVGSGGRDVLGELMALTGEDEQEWQERALCAQTDPEAFFPEKGGSTREAKRDLQQLRGPGRVPGVRARARRAFRDLGRALRAGAPSPQASRRLTRRHVSGASVQQEAVAPSPDEDVGGPF